MLRIESLSRKWRDILGDLLPAGGLYSVFDQKEAERTSAAASGTHHWAHFDQPFQRMEAEWRYVTNETRTCNLSQC